MERGHFHRRRRTWRNATGDWFCRNRLWLLIVILLSLAGVGAALIIGHFGRAFYNYNPRYYEPKDIERQIQELQKLKEGRK